MDTVAMLGTIPTVLSELVSSRVKTCVPSTAASSRVTTWMHCLRPATPAVNCS